MDKKGYILTYGQTQNDYLEELDQKGLQSPINEQNKYLGDRKGSEDEGGEVKVERVHLHHQQPNLRRVLKRLHLPARRSAGTSPKQQKRFSSSVHHL